MFDTVNHKTFFQKLSTLGVDEAARACNDECSDVASVSIDVAQGSILGPLLLIIYMNGPNVLQFCHVTLYADDTVLYLAWKSTADLQHKINADFGRIYINGLGLTNLSECQQIPFFTYW